MHKVDTHGPLVWESVQDCCKRLRPGYPVCGVDVKFAKSGKKTISLLGEWGIMYRLCEREIEKVRSHAFRSKLKNRNLKIIVKIYLVLYVSAVCNLSRVIANSYKGGSLNKPNNTSSFRVLVIVYIGLGLGCLDRLPQLNSLVNWRT